MVMRMDLSVQAERHLQRGIASLPTWLSRFLGHRGQKLLPSPTYILCIWGFIGAFGGVGILFAVFAHTEYFTSRAVPPIVASYGASAILCYGAIDVPLAQPRNLVFGHFFSALIGVIVATIFGFDLKDDTPDKLQWLGASLSTAIALVVMHLTKTTHPPAGATALLPCVDSTIWALRWYFLPVVLLSSSLVLVSALLVNNLQRQYPKFWIAPIPPKADPPQQPINNAPPASSDAEKSKSEHDLDDNRLKDVEALRGN